MTADSGSKYAKGILRRCRAVVCAAESFGSMTGENRRLREEAELAGKLLAAEELDTL